MSDNKIKVSGYSQRVFYNNGIEYRPFSGNLVGLQSTSLNDSATFTMGNFNVSANTETKVSKFFNTNRFSNFYDLTNLGIDLIDVETFLNRKKLSLKLRRNNLKNFAYFGSIKEYLRVSLENIILEWPAGMISSPIDYDNPGDVNYSFYNLVYDGINDISEFEIKKSLILNPFKINLTENNVFKDINPLRDFTINYYSYEVVGPINKFNVIYFEDLVGTIKIRVKGNINGELTNNTRFTIKPNNQSIEKFFKRLNNFEGYLLNRGSQPKFTASFDVNYINEFGVTIESQREVTWPITDGYNIAFDNQDYSDYVTELIEITEVSDTFDTDIMSRSLVANSILEFDTIPNVIGGNEVKEGQKINSLLKVYGRSFDEVKQYIDGISFAHVVTYDQEDNTPDEVLKILANTMGWDVFSTFKSESYIQDFLESNGNSFTGNNLELTNVEEEYEIWRRLILNTPWLWKSKGTRKGIEFLIKFLGIPDGLILFNEHIYRVDQRLDVVLINDILDSISGNTTSFYELPITEEGYPKISPNTDDMYFQKAGLWYRETGGPNANIEVYTGNNPHIGEYDGGQEYINQFKNIIPNFEPITVIRETKGEVINNLYTNNHSGDFNILPDNTTSVEFLNDDLVDISEFIIHNEEVSVKTPAVKIYDRCGCLDTSYNGALTINIRPKVVENICKYNGFSFGEDGIVVFNYNGYSNTITTAECCKQIGFTPEPFNGAFICRWKKEEPKCYTALKNDGSIWYFVNPIGNISTVVPYDYCCPVNSIPTLTKEGWVCYVEKRVDPPCFGYSETSETLDGYVVFNFQGDSTIYVPEPECCTALGYEYDKDNTGMLLSCLRCARYLRYEVLDNGLLEYVNFISDNGSTTEYVNSAECCPAKTVFTAINEGDDLVRYICVVNPKPPEVQCRYLDYLNVAALTGYDDIIATFKYCDGSDGSFYYVGGSPLPVIELVEACIILNSFQLTGCATCAPNEIKTLVEPVYNDSIICASETPIEDNYLSVLISDEYDLGVVGCNTALYQPYSDVYIDAPLAVGTNIYINPPLNTVGAGTYNVLMNEVGSTTDVYKIIVDDFGVITDINIC